MRITIWQRYGVVLMLGAAVLISACGGTNVSDKAARQSERFYEAASISWYEEVNTLAAIRSLTRSIDANPNNDDAHYLLGIIRLGRGEYEEAEKHLREAVRLRKDQDPSGLAGAMNNLGLLLVHRKRYKEAIELLEASANEVLNREPWLAMGNLGWAYIEIGEYEKAVEILRRAMFEQPKFCVGLYRLGQAYYMKKDYAQAEGMLKKAVEVKESGCSKLQDAYHLLGMSYLRRGEDAKARETLTRCSEIDTSSEVGTSCTEALAGL